MIYIRDDDVLFLYRQNLYPKPFNRFHQVHEWIKSNPRFLHRPGICVWEIKKYPECIQYIKKETDANRMSPQLHGFAHVDHTLMTTKNLISSFGWALEWFDEVGLPRPKLFYSPWGYQNEEVERVAKIFEMEAVGIDNTIRLKYVMRGLRDGRLTLDDLEEKEIYWHWWSGGDRIRRLVECK